MTTDKLGPCPLCGGEAATYDGGVFCADGCMGPYMLAEPVWSRLSALAAQNKRRGKALEGCRDAFLFYGWNGRMVEICEEALK